MITGDARETRKEPAPRPRLWPMSETYLETLSRRLVLEKEFGQRYSCCRKWSVDGEIIIQDVRIWKRLRPRLEWTRRACDDALHKSS